MLLRSEMCGSHIIKIGCRPYFCNITNSFYKNTKKLLKPNSIIITKIDAQHSLIALIPAFVAVLGGNVAAGAALALGILPTARMGVSPTRKQRIFFGVFGCLFGVGAFVGAYIIQFDLWLSSLLLFIIAFAFAISASRKPVGILLMTILLPSLGVGMSYSLESVINVTTLFIVGSIWSTITSLFFPEFDPEKKVSEQQKLMQPKYPKLYGVMLGLSASTALIISNMLGFDHTGWVVVAVLLIMRPLALMVGVRGITRALATIFGTIFGVLVVVINPANLIMGVLIIAISMMQAGTRKSEWYISPFGTAALLLILNFFGSTDTLSIQLFASERIIGNIIGAAIALFFGLLIPALVIKYFRPLLNFFPKIN